jgi:hypothetical protein
MRRGLNSGLFRQCCGSGSGKKFSGSTTLYFGYENKFSGDRNLKIKKFKNLNPGS